MTRDGDELRTLYRRLIEGPDGRPQSSTVSLETLEALVNNRLDEASRLEALDRVLADPVARREYDFLMEIAAQEPKVPAARGPRWFAIAAAFFLVIGAGLLWRVMVPENPNPLRGGRSDVLLAAPVEGATLRQGDLLTWHPVPGAISYHVEIVSPGGDVMASVLTADTTARLIPDTGESLVPGNASWFVTARLPNAVEVRSSSRKVTIAP